MTNFTCASRLFGSVLLLTLAACGSNPVDPRPSAFSRLESLQRQGVEAVEQDRWDRAVENFTEASRLARSMESRNEEAAAELNLAWLEEHSEQRALAEKRLQTLFNGPFTPALRGEAAYRLAKIAIDQKQIESAQSWMNQAQSLNGAGLKNGLAVLQIRLDILAGKTDIAQKALQTQISQTESPRKKANLLRLLAELQLQQKDANAALLSLNEAYALDRSAGRSAQLAQNLALQAQAQHLLNQSEAAQQSCQRSVLVCQAWLERFDAASQWRPRACGVERRCLWFF